MRKTCVRWTHALVRTMSLRSPMVLGGVGSDEDSEAGEILRAMVVGRKRDEDGGDEETWHGRPYQLPQEEESMLYHHQAVRTRPDGLDQWQAGLAWKWDLKDTRTCTLQPSTRLATSCKNQNRNSDNEPTF